MAHINIYIPDELKARMDKAGNRGWSAIAQRAFEDACNLVEVLMDTEDSVVARLRASKAEEDEELKAEGREAGRTWAREEADFRALKRVAIYEVWDTVQEEDLPDMLAALILKVKDLRDLDRHDARDLWEGLLGTGQTPDPAWIDGFVEGATEIWDKVANKI
jgi:muconolactone delta-isomerase